MQHANISIFIPHLGCPFNCIFCDQYKITGSDKAVTPRDIYDILIDAKTKGLQKSKTQIAFFGGSFTAIDRELMIDYLKVAYEFVKDGTFDSIRISTRPDCINKEIIDILKQYGVKTIELGVQSLCDEVLQTAKRGHSAKDSLDAARLIIDSGLELGMQMMCGLPGDTKARDIETAQKIIDIGCKQVRIYPVVVIGGTYLEKMYNDGRYTPLSVDKAVDICATLYTMFKNADVTILKIGLHSESGAVAGPFHASFGELVRSQVFYNEITSKIAKNSPVTIKCANRFVSIAKGHRGKNLTLFEDGGYNVKIIVDKDLENGYIIE